ncbi:hypothetical protein PIB30_049735 [Stylosanthes scabra]|uniref:Uncharacterized protein n=1 Tax=Stylosanthes scabra TaxID=79078 RepID=A0ABU6UGA9_9FABA|nr:hypothetical protein [Stylosanthes scabra]
MRAQSGVAIENTTPEEGTGDVARGVSGKATHSQIVQGADTSGGPNSEETNPVYESQVTPLLLVLMGECSDDTVMMGSMIQLEKGRLRDELHVQRTSSDGCSRPSKIQKVIDLTPEEKKRSGKMRKAQREPKWETFGEKIAVTFPTFIRCKFKITSQHKYNIHEAQYLAYIFESSLDPNEVLFRKGQRKMDREDLATLLPRNEPSDYIMEMMAYKTAWTQSQLPQTTLWSLPVHFSEIVIGGDVLPERLISLFKPEWLPRPTHLRYIYVQMKEILQHSKEAHLYLMVVDIQNGNIWILDNLASNDGAMERMMAVIVVATALDRVLEDGFPGLNVLGKRPPLATWQPEFVFYKDKIWVLLWLQMDQYFSLAYVNQSKKLVDGVAEKIRLDTGLALVTEHFNELKVDISKRAVEDWEDKRAASALRR